MDTIQSRRFILWIIVADYNFKIRSVYPVRMAKKSKPEIFYYRVAAVHFLFPVPVCFVQPALGA